MKTKTTYRPHNSVRFICPCGRLQTFPRSPERKDRDKIVTYMLKDGTAKTVSKSEKTVTCACGHVTFKSRLNFKGR